MEATLRQTWAFLFRGYHITRRYIGWVIVFNFYALVTSATVALIGVAEGNYQLTLTLIVGALLWNYLSRLYEEISMSIAYERWEGTLEYTFMAPVSRAVHLLGVSLFSLLNSIVTSVIVLLGLLLFTNLNLHGANLPGVLVVLAVSTVAFVGLGLFAAVFPVMSPERGAEATHIFQGSLLLVSGSLLSDRSPATLVATVVCDLTGDVHVVCLPEVVRCRERRFDRRASRGRAALGRVARAARVGVHGRDTLATWLAGLRAD
jgi:ABC-2 type transport system permease protein